jgi:hypothetical protein
MFRRFSIALAPDDIAAVISCIVPTNPDNRF